MRTKFFRFLHSLTKGGQDATSKTYKLIPIQNFTDESDIDWSMSDNEIDEQLFDKYKLNEKEREYIRASIKEMDYGK